MARKNQTPPKNFEEALAELEQILADIEEVVVATNSMTSALEELAPYEQMVAKVG